MGGGTSQPASSKEVDWVFEQLDMNKDKRLSVEELVAAAVSQKVAADWPEARIKETVATFDKDGDGLLNQEEWHAAFDELGRHGIVAERMLVAALSEARTNPKALAGRLQKRLEHYRGNEYYPPERGGKVAIATKEGKKVVEEAIAYLKVTPPPPALVEPPDDVAIRALRLACEDHLVDKGTLGHIGHEGSDGSHSMERQMRYGVWSGACGECLWFGRQGASAASMVEDLVIDDGVKSRGHRLCIFDPNYTVAAARVGAHTTFGSMAVIAFAGEYCGDAAKVAAREAAGAPKPQPGAKAKEETQWKGKLGICAGCKQEIKGGAVMEVAKLGVKFHKACFTCRECARSLVGVPWKAEAGKAYCADCHAQQFAPKCAGCGEPITGSGVKIGGVSYHKECKPVAAPAGDAAAVRGAAFVGKAKAAPKKGGALKSKAAAKPSMMSAKNDVGGLMADYGAF